MKFKELPKLTNVRHNAHCVSLNRLHDALETFEREYGLDLDPYYQRGHVWSNSNKIKFIEFLLKGGKCNPLYFNCIAYNEKYKGDYKTENTKVELVDGKQRLTAILEFLDDKIPVFDGHFLSDFEDKILLLRSIHVSFIVNDILEEKLKLKWYLEINEGNIAHEESELQRIRDKISEL